MTREEGLNLLETMLELPPKSLGGPEKLEDMQGWDSLANLNFIATVDFAFGLPLPGGRVAACRTVNDLIALLETELARRAA
jgi:acyl carrier protein